MELMAREWDLIKLPSGEILTVVGTYRRSKVRGRLTYVPDDDGDVEIFGRRYRKTSYEIWRAIPHARQVLALPGESHYTVLTHEIARHYPAVPLQVTTPKLAELVTALSAVDIPISVGGSRALDAARTDSDYDLVVYGKENIKRAAKIITGLDGYEPWLHFGRGFVRAKYCHFTRLTRDDLETLVGDRWRHFRFRGLAMSVDGSDERLLSDRWTTGAVRAFDTAHVQGTVLDGSQCYFSPKIVDVQTDSGIIRVSTWLNLYAGALRTGDQVTVYGRWVVIHGQQFLQVQDSVHAIRVVSRTSTNPV